MRFLVGTSGWQYRDWRGQFYPPGLPLRRQLEYYGSRWPTVENNSTFYRLPPRQTFADWARRTPAGFAMAIKASRYLTHLRRLREPAEPVARLLAAAAGLGDRLGPILLQLPPDFEIDTTRLDRCLAEFGSQRDDVRIAVELRNDTWWTPAVKSLLTSYNAALVWSDRREHPVAPLWRTADWAYLRLHEGTARPRPRYHRRTLHEWSDRLAALAITDSYVYFNNDQHAAAPADAAAFVTETSR